MSNNTNPHILVAGGAGYIGSHTSQLLARSGFVPVSLDNFATGHRSAVRFGPLVEASIGDQDAVRQALREYNITAVILFAGHAYVGESTQNPLKYYQNNLAASFRFLEALREEGVSRLVFSSSCSIFGQKTHTPLVEDSPKDPLSPYAETKWFFEKVLHWCGHAHGLRFMSLRYFNAAGADPQGEIGEDHEPETHLIPLALDAASGGPALTVFGTDYPTPDGTAVRDYIHVTDLADAHLRALRHLLADGQSNYVNLGTGQGHSVKQVMSCVEQVVGAPVQASFGPRREGDAPQLVANPALARELLQWTPQHSSLEEIVRTAWLWRKRKKGL